MKKLSLRMVAVLMLCVLAGCAFSALAASDTAGNAVQPRWTELWTFQCAMDHKDGWFTNAHVASTVSTHHSASKLELTLTLQVMSGGAFTDTDRVWTSSGSGATSIGKDLNLAEGNYRAKAVVKVYSSSGEYLETVTMYSNDILI